MATPFDRSSVIDDPALAGLSLCRSLAEHTDRWLVDVFADAGAPPTGMALVAVGGYGRRELSPMSDLDLLLLHEPKLDAKVVRDVAEKVWYPIWDQKLKLGHAVRTVKEACALAADDLDTATSFLSIRHLAGDERLTTELVDKAGALWRKRSKRWLAELSRRVKERHDAAGEVAFLLEPDLKEGRGGLRDVHAFLWAEAADAVMLTGDEEELNAAYDVLLSARVELHRRTGRAGNVLLLQEQDGVATALGYADADALMRAISTAARTIAWTSDEQWFRIDSSLSGPSVAFRRDKPVHPGVVLREGLVHLAADADPAADPLLVLWVGLAAAEHGARIDRQTLDRLVAGVPEPFPWTPKARQLFADLFRAGRGAIAVVETFDQRGVWSRLVPEWDAVRCKPQRNAFHVFTVDRHLCETAVNAGERADQVGRPDLLVVGALFHDIGKGYPGDHTEVGIDLVCTMGERMGYAPDEIAVLCDMVRYHLLLPEVATRRDITDDGTVRFVADAMGSVGTLRILGALTEADSRATGPTAWNQWKADLVRQLVERTAHVLGGGSLAEVGVDAFPTASQLELMAAHRELFEARGNELLIITTDRPGIFARVSGVLALNGLDVLEAAAYSSDGGVALDVFTVESSTPGELNWDRVRRDLDLALAGRLALAARLAERARIYQRPRSAVLGPVEPTVEFDNQLSDQATVVEVHAPDAIGVLYRITLAIAELELDIRSAKVHTLGHEVVDAFYLRDREGNKITDESYLREIERAILHALRP